MSQFSKPDEDMLPLHPNISQAFENCEKELKSTDPKPANKSDGKAGQYEVGVYFSTQSRKIFPHFFLPLGTPGFGKAMEAKTKLSTILDKAPAPPDFSDKELREREVEIKRMISVQSVMHWGHNALENITDQGRGYAYVGYQRVGQQAAQTQPAQGAKGANQGSKGRSRGGRGASRPFEGPALPSMFPPIPCNHAYSLPKLVQLERPPP